MYNGTERLGFQCVTPGPGVVNIPECFNPYRTAGVQCFQSECVANVGHTLVRSFYFDWFQYQMTNTLIGEHLAEVSLGDKPVLIKCRRCLGSLQVSCIPTMYIWGNNLH